MKAKQKTYTPKNSTAQANRVCLSGFLLKFYFVTFRLLSTLRVTAIGACTLSAVL